MRKSVRKSVTSRQLYVIIALVIVVFMALGGSGLLTPSNTPASPPTAVPPTAQGGAAEVPLGPTYLHPSGYFEIDPPAGWNMEDKTEGNVASASWVGSAQGAVLHAFTFQFTEPVTQEQLVREVENEFSGGLGNYTSYTVTRQNYDGDPITVDFSLMLDDTEYLAREWAGAEDTLLWVLRAVTPATNPALLTFFEETVLPTYRVFPDIFPVPIGWETYTNAERAYTFKHPAGWADHGTGQDGARRFVDSQTGWQSEMAVLVQPGTSVRTEDSARAWLEALLPGAQVSSIETATRQRGEGYLVSFTYPVEGGQRRGVLLLLNANDAVYRVDLRLPPGADDPLNQEAQQRAQQAIDVMQTFTGIAAAGPIPTPAVGG